jgi:hypothetical protein
MGNKISSQPKSVGDDDALAQRAAKRRRIDTEYDGFPLLEDHATAQRALRIEVLKISHKEAPRVKNGILNGVVAPNVRDVVHVKARCKLTICGYKAGEAVVLHVDSQLCDLRIFKKDPAGFPKPMARFSSIRPFHIPEEKIFLERDDDAVFGLGNSYSVFVELESAGDGNWPPKELLPMSELVPKTDEDTFYNRTLPSRQWVLYANIRDIFAARNRKTARLQLKKPTGTGETEFYLDMDVRWMTPISSNLRPREHSKDILSSISVVDLHERAPPQPNGNAIVNGDAGVGHDTQVNGVRDPKAALQLQQGASLGEPGDDMAEGELTPSRSRRARQDINYNVKQMWNNAVGREPRKRRRHGDENGHPNEHKITYILPPEQVQTDKFSCLLCGAENDRLSQLRAHYLCHPQYDFHFESRPKAGYCVTVKPIANGNGSPLRPRVYQLGLPVKPLDLEKYVNGDDSWVTSRLGPDNDREVYGAAGPKATREVGIWTVKTPRCSGANRLLRNPSRSVPAKRSSSPRPNNPSSTRSARSNSYPARLCHSTRWTTPGCCSNTATTCKTSSTSTRLRRSTCKSGTPSFCASTSPQSSTCRATFCSSSATRPLGWSPAVRAPTSSASTLLSFWRGASCRIQRFLRRPSC